MLSDYIEPSVSLYNAIMGTTETVTTYTTGDSTIDLAISWLAASMRYSEDVTTARDSRRGGLLVWERFEQRAFQLMAHLDRTKFKFSEGVGLYVPRTYDASWIGAYVRNDAEDEESYTG